MSCTVEKRQRAQRCADALGDAACVLAVDVLDPDESHLDAWTVDAVIRSEEGVPPGVLRELALEQMTLRPSPGRHEFSSVVATA